MGEVKERWKRYAPCPMRIIELSPHNGRLVDAPGLWGWNNREEASETLNYSDSNILGFSPYIKWHLRSENLFPKVVNWFPK